MPGSTKSSLVAHLRTHAVRTDGPFTLRSGEQSDWYIDARQTTFDGVGARLVGEAIAAMLPVGTTAVGGLTMGADPIAIATAMASTPPLKAFSIRKEAKTHGAGGRLVGPVTIDDRVVVVEDTTTTGGAIMEAVEVLQGEGIAIAGVVSLVDRSGGAVAARLAAHDLAYQVVVSTEELGVT
jgi:orotate phosphoribosyltransferase